MNPPVSASCVECESHLVELVYDEVAGIPEDCVAHLQSCARCAGEIESLKRTRLKAALPLESPSEALDLRILEAFDAHQETTVVARASRRSRRWMPSMAAAAGLSLVAVATVFFADDTPNARGGRATETTAAPARVLKPQAEEATQRALPSTQASGAVAPETQARPALRKAKSPPPAPAPVADEMEDTTRSFESEKASVAPAPEADKRAAKVSKKEVETSSPVARPSRPKAEANDERVEQPAQARTPSMAAPRTQDAVSAAEVSSPHQVFVEDQETALGGSSRARRDVLKEDSMMAAADQAARQGEHEKAVELYERVARANDLPASVVSRALAGQARSLLALKRYAEASAVAHRLAAESDDRAALLAEIEVARDAGRHPVSRPASVP